MLQEVVELDIYVKRPIFIYSMENSVTIRFDEKRKFYLF